MKKVLITLLMLVISLPVFSQGFNDSLMNSILFDVLVKHVTKRDSTVKLVYSKVASDLETTPAVEYMKTHGVRHRPTDIYLKALPKDERNVILKDIGIDNVEDYRLGDGEILVRIFITNTTTYQDVAKQAIDAWLKSPEHAPTINNFYSSHTVVIAISSSYNKESKSIDIALGKFTLYNF